MAARADEHLPQAALMRSSGASLLRDAGYDVALVTSEYEHLAMRTSAGSSDVRPRNENEQAYMLASGGGRVVDDLPAGTWTRRLAGAPPTRGPPRNRTLTHGPSAVRARPSRLAALAICAQRGLHGPAVRLPDARNAARGWVAGDEISVQISANQTRCIDAQLASAIPDVVAARPNAVVIVLSDHGPKERLDWWHPDEQGTHDRLANLFWARTPGHAELFPTGISLVNVLPSLRTPISARAAAASQRPVLRSR